MTRGPRHHRRCRRPGESRPPRQRRAPPPTVAAKRADADYPAGSPGASPALLRFASASCQNWQQGYYPAHAAIAAEDLDFVAFLGDYIYESGVSASAVRPHDGPRISDLAGYRNRYALHKGDPDLQAAHRAFPWIVTWDDHEVSNNYAGLVQDEGLSNPQLFPQLRAAAYLAWYEHTPVRLLPPADRQSSASSSICTERESIGSSARAPRGATTSSRLPSASAIASS